METNESVYLILYTTGGICMYAGVLATSAEMARRQLLLERSKVPNMNILSSTEIPAHLHVCKKHCNDDSSIMFEGMSNIGDSCYTVAVANGFKGTLEDWIHAIIQGSGEIDYDMLFNDIDTKINNIQANLSTSLKQLVASELANAQQVLAQAATAYANAKNAYDGTTNTLTAAQTALNDAVAKLNTAVTAYNNAKSLYDQMSSSGNQGGSDCNCPTDLESTLTGFRSSLTSLNTEITSIKADIQALQNNSGGGSTGATVAVIDNLTSTSTTSALSANQGKVLKSQIDGKQATISDLSTIRTNASNAVTSIGTLSSLNTTAKGNLVAAINEVKTAVNNIGTGGNGGTATPVVDSLTSTSTTSALSANQGKVLNDSKLNKTDVVNNLTTTDTAKALSAAQGKALKDSLTTLTSKVTTLETAIDSSSASSIELPFLSSSAIQNPKYVDTYKAQWGVEYRYATKGNRAITLGTQSSNNVIVYSLDNFATTKAATLNISDSFGANTKWSFACDNNYIYVGNCNKTPFVIVGNTSLCPTDIYRSSNGTSWEKVFTTADKTKYTAPTNEQYKSHYAYLRGTSNHVFIFVYYTTPPAWTNAFVDVYRLDFTSTATTFSLVKEDMAVLKDTEIQVAGDVLYTRRPSSNVVVMSTNGVDWNPLTVEWDNSFLEDRVSVIERGYENVWLKEVNGLIFKQFSNFVTDHYFNTMTDQDEIRNFEATYTYVSYDNGNTWVEANLLRTDTGAYGGLTGTYTLQNMAKNINKSQIFYLNGLYYCNEYTSSDGKLWYRSRSNFTLNNNQCVITFDDGRVFAFEPNAGSSGLQGGFIKDTTYRLSDLVALMASVQLIETIKKD